MSALRSLPAGLGDDDLKGSALFSALDTLGIVLVRSCRHQARSVGQQRPSWTQIGVLKGLFKHRSLPFLDGGLLLCQLLLQHLQVVCGHHLLLSSDDEFLGPVEDITLAILFR